jgi:predicted Zn-dependent protease
MTETSLGAETAHWVAERIRAPEPWEVYAERSRRYELHFNGKAVELVHGPVTLHGYGIRVLRSRDGKTGTGFQSSTDLSEDGIRAALGDAEGISRYSEFPAKKVELPTKGPPHGGGPKIVDPALWARPLETVEEYFSALIASFERHPNVVPSFGSVRVTLTETSIANSAGLRTSYPQTTVELEVGVKAFGGPEGAPPGEFWVTDTSRRLDLAGLTGAVERWCRYAQDVRRAVAPPSGELAVVLPASVLAGILPQTLGFKLSGVARLRKLAPTLGQAIGSKKVTIRDDGCYDWATAAAPCDDEGTPQRARTLVASGAVEQIVYDSLYGAAFDTRSTASAIRSVIGGAANWMRFTSAPGPGASTLVVGPGEGGTEAEVIEAARDGIWVQQLGWASPYALTSAFGGEIRIGYRIRNGKLAEPVRGGIVGGLVMAPPGSPSMLSNVETVGRTVELAEGVASPAMLVRPLTVAGGAA